MEQINFSQNLIQDPILNSTLPNVLDEFEGTISYVKNYLQGNSTRVSCISNQSGFVRINLPKSPDSSDEVEGVRVNYWRQNMTLANPEALHSHPRYFESKIIHGGYSHITAIEANKTLSNKEPWIKQYRIHKNNNSLTYEGILDLFENPPVYVNKGEIAKFPTSMVHRIASVEPGTLSINVVHKPELTNHFDLFVPLTENNREMVEERHEVLPGDDAYYLLGGRQTLDSDGCYGAISEIISHL